MKATTHVSRPNEVLSVLRYVTLAVTRIHYFSALSSASSFGSDLKARKSKATNESDVQTILKALK